MSNYLLAVKGHSPLSFLGVNDFAIAASGGTASYGVTFFAPWSGEGTVTVIVYPEKQKPGMASVPGDSMTYNRDE